MTCWNCGIPQDSASAENGQSLEIKGEKQYGDKRPRKKTIWVCSGECAVQTLGQAKYGIKTSSWPITLDQFRPIARRQLRRKGNFMDNSIFSPDDVQEARNLLQQHEFNRMYIPCDIRALLNKIANLSIQTKWELVKW